jgi:hypothetical protein
LTPAGIRLAAGNARDRVWPLDELVKRLIQSSAPRQRIVNRDRTLEVVGLRAGDQANVLQRRKLLLGLGGLSEHQIEFTEVLVGAAMATIEQ